MYIDALSIILYNFYKVNHMNNVTIYSKYLLYAAIILFLIVLVYTLTKALSLLQAVSAYQDDFTRIKTNLEDVKTRGGKIANTIKSFVDVSSKVLPVAILLLAVKDAYKEEEENGAKGVQNSFKTVMRKRSENEAYKNQLSKVFKK